eukprot:PLAT4372.1.p1 GENE.PLAT4372.1~~PLAT4372.1.p1  ORF type:complete len:594 (+),score=289.41 PLAT4372.1:73-1854(+)
MDTPTRSMPFRRRQASRLEMNDTAVLIIDDYTDWPMEKRMQVLEEQLDALKLREGDIREELLNVQSEKVEAKRALSQFHDELKGKGTALEEALKQQQGEETRHKCALEQTSEKLEKARAVMTTTLHELAAEGLRSGKLMRYAGLFFRTWRKSRVCLKPLCIEFYDGDDVKPSASLDLLASTSVKLVEPAAEEGFWASLSAPEEGFAVFVVCTGDKEVRLATNGADERQRWVEAVRTMVDILQQVRWCAGRAPGEAVVAKDEEEKEAARLRATSMPPLSTRLSAGMRVRSPSVTSLGSVVSASDDDNSIEMAARSTRSLSVTSAASLDGGSGGGSSGRLLSPACDDLLRQLSDLRHCKEEKIKAGTLLQLSLEGQRAVLEELAVLEFTLTEIENTLGDASSPTKSVLRSYFRLQRLDGYASPRFDEVEDETKSWSALSSAPSITSATSSRLAGEDERKEAKAGEDGDDDDDDGLFAGVARLFGLSPRKPSRTAAAAGCRRLSFSAMPDGVLEEERRQVKRLIDDLALSITQRRQVWEDLERVCIERERLVTNLGELESIATDYAEAAALSPVAADLSRRLTSEVSSSQLFDVEL